MSQKTYSSKFKRKIVEEYLSCKNYAEVGRNNNLTTMQVKLWVDKYNEFGMDYFEKEHRGAPKKLRKLFECMTPEEQKQQKEFEHNILKIASTLYPNIEIDDMNGEQKTAITIKAKEKYDYKILDIIEYLKLSRSIYQYHSYKFKNK